MNLQVQGLLLPLFTEFEGTMVPTPQISRGTCRYRQVTLPPEEEDLGPPVVLHKDYVRFLRLQPVHGLTDWTLQLVRELAARPGYAFSAADVTLQPAPEELRPDHLDGVLPPEQWEKVARALSAHLAHSSGYTYTLDLRRQDRSIDPTLDFLSNVKQGHCERYAGGLALMLRSLGIPARIVSGFGGAENVGEGRYEIRHSHAHVWVETLATRRSPDGNTHWHWLALDPTPAGEVTRPPLLSLSRWWDNTLEAGSAFWKDFVLDYRNDRQEELWSGLLQSASRFRPRRLLSPGTWALGGLLAGAAIAGIWLLRPRLRRRGAAPAAVCPVGFYRRLLAILARRRRLRPLPAQTPREFAETVAAALALAPLTAELATLPVQVAELLYRVRFGGQPLSAVEGQDVEARLDRLDAALATR